MDATGDGPVGNARRLGAVQVVGDDLVEEREHDRDPASGRRPGAGVTWLASGDRPPTKRPAATSQMPHWSPALGGGVEDGEVGAVAATTSRR